MTLANICKTILGLIMMINIFAYPISKNITNPEKVNSIFDRIDFETKFLEIFERLTINQLATQTGTTTEAIEEQISGDLISTESLRIQRITAVESFYESVENKQIPQIRFEIQNPISKFTENLEAVASNFFDSILNIELCSQGTETWFCETLCGFVNCPTEEVAPQADEEIQPNFVIETSLGITQENIEKVNLWYRVLKYGPDLLLVLSILLIIVGYISSFPSRKFALSMVWMGIQLCVTAFIFWASIPGIVNLATPVRIEPFTDVQGSINSLIASIVSEIGKEAFIIPVVFLVINVFMLLGLFLYDKYVKSKEGLDSYGKEKPGDVPGLKGEVKKDSKTEVDVSSVSSGSTITSGSVSDE